MDMKHFAIVTKNFIKLNCILFITQYFKKVQTANLNEQNEKLGLKQRVKL